MDVSIILVNYNTKELTRDCLKSILDKTQGLNSEIFVVDNASSDGSCEMIEQEFSQIKLIKNSQNLGFGKANNIAIKQSNAKYIFLLNTDTILLNNAVKMFFDFMEKPENSKVGCCGGNLYNQDMSYQHTYSNFPTFKKIIFEELWLHKVFKTYYRKNINIEDNKPLEEVKDVGFIVGASLFLRKEALDKVGCFDEDFFFYGEETELIFRLIKNGYRATMIPETKIIHLGGASTSKTRLEKIIALRKSENLYFIKSYGKVYAFEVRIMRFICDIIKTVVNFDSHFVKRSLWI